LGAGSLRKHRGGRPLDFVGRHRQGMAFQAFSVDRLAMRSDRDITTIDVSQPRTRKAFVDQQVQQGSYATVSDDSRDLIRREQRAAAREELERKLLEGLDSGAAEEITEADWSALRDRIVERRPERRGGWRSAV
jgi:putative addiction module CopG family antidote